MALYISRRGHTPLPFYLPGAPLAAYSTRRLVASYTGSALNIRRDSDNATMDVGFIGTNLDIPAAVAFIGTGNGFVTTWYDQSGNGNHAVQATNAAQPWLTIVGSRAWLAFSASFLATASAVPLLGDSTIGIVRWPGLADTIMFPISDYDGANGWGILDNYPSAKQASYWDNGGGFVSTSGADIMTPSPCRTISTRASGTATLRQNGIVVASSSGHSTTTPSCGLCIGGHDASSNWSGPIAEAYVYSSALGSSELNTIDQNAKTYWGGWGFDIPYSGSSQIATNGSDCINFGNILQFERTQPWTIFVAFRRWGNTTTDVYFTNVPNAADNGGDYAGYEFWTGPKGELHARIMHSVTVDNEIHVIGGTNTSDGRAHFAAFTYDGSSTAAGVNIYLDGALQTMTVLNDNLTGTIVNANCEFVIGNQTAEAFGVPGVMSHFQIDTVARSAAYIADYCTPSSLPPIDGNTAISLALSEGSGTTASDSSGNGHTGTLTSADLWVP